MTVVAHNNTPVTETIHGVAITDSYRWLENPQSSATRAWVAQQALLYQAYCSSLRELPSLRRRVRACLNVESVDQAARTKMGLIYRSKKPDTEQPSIYFKASHTSAEEILVDSSQMSPFSSVSICKVSDDGELAAIGIREGGSDARTIKIIEVFSKRLMPFELAPGTLRGIVFAPALDGIFYCHENDPLCFHHVVRFHSFCSPQLEDPVVFRVKKDTHTRLLLVSDGRYLGIVHRYKSSTSTLIDFYLANHELHPRWRAVLTNVKTPASPLLRDGRLFLLGGMNGAPVSIRELTLNGRVIEDLVPEPHIPVSQVEATNDAFYVTITAAGKTFVHRWSFVDSKANVLDVPQDGTITLHSPLSDRASSLFVSYESFAKRPRLIECLQKGDITSALSTADDTLDAVTFSTTTSNYRSKDSTAISITILSPNPTRWSLPTVLSAYGGFGVAVTPQFSVLAQVLLENGVCFAVPNIRGGIEKGPAWHEAAQKEGRQRAFDDFIAAAEWLIGNKIAASNQLGICGGSNAGLLVGAVMTQRPDLFKAVLCISPILDMIRYERFDNAKRWVGEFGTVDNAPEFFSLLSYSPYHQVREDEDYPASLFVTGSKDERCNPAHAMKMVARLQDRKAQRRPILLDYSAERGHAPCMPMSIRIEALSVRLAFLLDELNNPLRSTK